MLPLSVLIVALILAPLGYVRITAFVVNHAIFGHRRDVPTLQWTIAIVPPLLLVLTYLFVPLVREFNAPTPSTAAQGGAVWLLIAALFGLGWIVETLVHKHHKSRIDKAEAVSSNVIRLRRGHIHYPALQRLGLHNDVYDLEVNLYRIYVPDLPPAFRGYRIAFLSDTHVAAFMRKVLYDTCAEQIRAANADLILLGGDYVTWARHITLMAARLTDGLNPPDGMYAVLGNHDYWADADGVVTALTMRGVRFLHNQSVRIERDRGAIYVGGIDEIYRGKPDVAATLSAIPHDAPRIVISHHPDIVDYIGDDRIDLLLAGHTHGGQICVPFFGPILVPSVHETRYAAGFFQQRNLLMYVGRGIGAVPPIRILCRPELPIFELTDAVLTE